MAVSGYTILKERVFCKSCFVHSGNEWTGIFVEMRQNDELDGNDFPGRGIFGTELENVGCWIIWLRSGFFSPTAVVDAVLGHQKHACRGEEKTTLLLCSHSMYPCTRMHVYRHVHTVQMQHTEKPCCCLIAFNPHLMCAFAEGTMENVFWWVLLPSVREMGTVGARVCSPLSISLCYRRFL